MWYFRKTEKERISKENINLFKIYEKGKNITEKL
jgi:hypothetical protein